MICPTCGRSGYQTAKGTFGRRIREYRRSLGLGQREAGQQIGIGFNSLSRIERGHMPGLKAFAATCQWAGIDIRWGLEAFKIEAAVKGKSQ